MGSILFIFPSEKTVYSIRIFWMDADVTSNEKNNINKFYDICTYVHMYAQVKKGSYVSIQIYFQ